MRLKATMLEIIHSFGRLCFTYLITLISELMKIFFPVFFPLLCVLLLLIITTRNYLRRIIQKVICFFCCCWNGATIFVYCPFHLNMFETNEKKRTQLELFEFDWLIAIKMNEFPGLHFSHNQCAFGISFRWTLFFCRTFFSFDFFLLDVFF